MTVNYGLKDLEYWDERIRELVDDVGLSCFPQEFELCDHFQMLSYAAYGGMPSRYPHWSYGKSYERQKTLYDHGVSGLPYEMVINSNPSLAYLMRENSLCLQILTMAHVYAHNDFFKNNFMYGRTAPESVVGSYKARADRVRGYVEDPSIGQEKVEAVLDAAHALSFQCRRHPAIRKLTLEQSKDHALVAAQPAPDPYRRIHKSRPYEEPDLQRVPLEPEEDVLLFVRDVNPYLAEWEKDLLTIVHEETQYFIPQMETKIMNEGWATYWHREIMKKLDPPQDIYLEFLVRHNQVVRPTPGEINPYHVGLAVWDDICRRYDEPTDEEIERDGEPQRSAREVLFEVRESDRDVSFLRRFLNETLVCKLNLLLYNRSGDKFVVTKVADKENWHDVKDKLIQFVGMGSVPVVRVVDADFGRTRTLHLQHEYDGRDMDLNYAAKTLGHLHQLWGRDVVLSTVLDNESKRLVYNDDGFAVREEK